MKKPTEQMLKNGHKFDDRRWQKDIDDFMEHALEAKIIGDFYHIDKGVWFGAALTYEFWGITDPKEIETFYDEETVHGMETFQLSRKFYNEPLLNQLMFMLSMKVAQDGYGLCPCAIKDSMDRRLFSDPGDGFAFMNIAEDLPEGVDDFTFCFGGPTMFHNAIQGFNIALDSLPDDYQWSGKVRQDLKQ